jgi:RNA polymerase sigma-70 factor (ECF subfamily)
MSDRELILKAQQGHTFAFEALVERHRDQVYALGLRLTRSATVAAEIAQESFLSACLHLKEFQNEAEFAAWVHWIAASHASLRLQPVRTAHNAEEQPKVHQPKALGTRAHHPKMNWSDDVDERPLTPELRRAVLDATDQLPQRDREVFLFKDVAGLSYQQIASICGEPISAIKSRLLQARLSLRGAIDHFYSAAVNRSAELTAPVALIPD